MEALFESKARLGQAHADLDAANQRNTTTESALAQLRDQVDDLNANVELMDGERARLASEVERLENERSQLAERHEREMSRLREEFERAAARAADGERAHLLESQGQRMQAELLEKQSRIEQMAKRINIQETEISALRRLAGAPDPRGPGKPASIPSIPSIAPLGKSESGIGQALRGVALPPPPPADVEVFELDIEDSSAESEELIVLEEELTDPGTKKR
jgi:hypothetical protein